jgi:hypothetical protein
MTSSKRCASSNCAIVRSTGGRSTCLGALLAIAIATGTSSFAQTSPQPPGEGMGGPPPEALEACAGNVAADVCTMALPGQNAEVSGQCITTPDNQIACLPDGAPPPPPQGG